MHDGEVFYYRSDRPVRSGSAVAVRPPMREPYYEPEPPSARVTEDRIARLEAMVERLEATVVQLTEAVQGAVQRSAPERDARPVRAASARPEPEVQYLKPEEAAREMADLAGIGPVLHEENVKVSMFAGGGATAVVGQIKVTPAG